MKKHLTRTILLAIALICSFGCSSDEEYDAVGSIYGVVTDAETNSPIQGASVLLTPSNTSVTTGADGLYNFNDIKAGQYKLTVTKSGYMYNSSQVNIVADETIIKDVNIGKEVEIVGFSITPSALSFGANYGSLTFSIKNDSSLSSNSWSANIGDASWLTLTPTSGTIEVGETITVRADVDRSLIAEDSMGIIILEANGGSKQILVTVSGGGDSQGGSSDDSNDDGSYGGTQDGGNEPSEDSDGYIGIYDSSELCKIGIDDEYPLDGKYRLKNNVTLSGYWTPINAFSGTFDGDGHSISGLKIDAMTDNQGLFGSVDKATIKDVIIKSPSVKSTANNVGALVGSSKAYSIEGCSVEGGSVSGGTDVGGLVGEYYLAYSIKASISSCYSSSAVSGSENVGGIVGSLVAEGASMSITSSYNTGKVSGKTILGGIAGYMYIDSDGDINVSSCYNTGSVISDNDNYIGGLIGYVDEGYNGDSNKLTISSCYNTANISGGSSLGGIVGLIDNPTMIAFCYNTGAITGRGSSNGGVVGSTSTCSNIIFASCYNTGTIEGYESVGGIVGFTWYGKAYSCYFIDQLGDDASSGFGDAKYSSDTTEKVSFDELNSSTVIYYLNNSSYKSYGSYTAGDPADTYLPSLMGEKIVY